MKLYHPLVTLLLSAHLAIAGFKVPKSVFTMEELDEAKQKAIDSNKPLIFVYTDPDTTSEPSATASLAAFKNFKSAGTVVYAYSKTDWSKLPTGAKEGKKQSGRIIPMVFVTNSTGEQHIETFTYEDLAEDARQAARDLKKRVEELENSDSTTTEEEKASDKDQLLAEKQEWTNSSGKSITAAVQSADAEQVVFLIKGKEVTYPLEKLSAESQEKIQSLLTENE